MLGKLGVALQNRFLPTAPARVFFLIDPRVLGFGREQVIHEPAVLVASILKKKTTWPSKMGPYSR